MPLTNSLYWLPSAENFASKVRSLKEKGPTSDELSALAKSRLSFTETEQLDKLASEALPLDERASSASPQVRLALLSSSTTKHLHSAIRVAALRRDLQIEIYEADYAQYWTELRDTSSKLYDFKPNVVLFALDARRLTSGFPLTPKFEDAAAAADQEIGRLADCWKIAQDAFGALAIQQTVLPVLPNLIGQNEHLFGGSSSNAVRLLNERLRVQAPRSGVCLLALDSYAARDGVSQWHSESYWRLAKQEVCLRSAAIYGDLVMRLVAARFGRAAKCLVLDLDNTLWGGVIGDDGLEGIALGQGSAEGEAFVAFQDYARSLTKRGVILAVCSKNDEANAFLPFDKHPDMVLRRSDVACFIANWRDKATNIRDIASKLSIGLDSLVFVDDNPFERNLVRQELPMVHVPELPDDPGQYAQCISDAGYFEVISFTEEDVHRSSQYQQNIARAALSDSVTDIETYLKALEMKLAWSHFDKIGLSRIVQLINRSNQFNVTTKRYDEQDICRFMDNEKTIGLQLRLLDRYGDNGMISVLILKIDGPDAYIDTWLMSCRVLGRCVEEAALMLLMMHAKRLGARRLIGQYLATAKNHMVSDLYTRLGFSSIASPHGEAGDWYSYETVAYTEPDLPMIIQNGFVAAKEVTE